MDDWVILEDEYYNLCKYIAFAMILLREEWFFVHGDENF
jgi:hypothetical protein